MADEDTFIREVDEQIRQDRAREIWSRYGKFIIAGAVAIVAGTAGLRGWEYYTNQQMAASGDRFMEAIDLSGKGQHDEASAVLNDLAATASGNYPELARMRLAAELAEKGEMADAIKAFDAIAATGSAPAPIRELAQLRAGLLAVDLEDFSSVEARLATLASAGNAYRHSAREGLAIAAIKAGEDARALDWLTQVSQDNDAPDNIRGRAELMLQMLAGKGVTAGS